MATGGIPALGNTRAGKKRLEYDGHSRKPGVAERIKTLRWRHARRKGQEGLRAIVRRMEVEG